MFIQCLARARHHLGAFHILTEPLQQHYELGRYSWFSSLFSDGDSWIAQRKLRADLGGDWAFWRTCEDHCGESGMSQKKSTEEGQARSHPDAKAMVKMLAFILKATVGPWSNGVSLCFKRTGWRTDRLKWGRNGGVWTSWWEHCVSGCLSCIWCTLYKACKMVGSHWIQWFTGLSWRKASAPQTAILSSYLASQKSRVGSITYSSVSKSSEFGSE